MSSNQSTQELKPHRIVLELIGRPQLHVPQSNSSQQLIERLLANLRLGKLTLCELIYILEQLFDMLDLNECQKLFDKFKTQLQTIETDQMAQRSYLKFLNVLLRRIPLNLFKFRGSVILFLTKVLPVNHDSGLIKNDSSMPTALQFQSIQIKNSKNFKSCQELLERIVSMLKLYQQGNLLQQEDSQIQCKRKLKEFRKNFTYIQENLKSFQLRGVHVDSFIPAFSLSQVFITDAHTRYLWLLSSYFFVFKIATSPKIGFMSEQQRKRNNELMARLQGQMVKVVKEGSKLSQLAKNQEKWVQLKQAVKKRKTQQDFSKVDCELAQRLKKYREKGNSEQSTMEKVQQKLKQVQSAIRKRLRTEEMEERKQWCNELSELQQQ